MCRTLQHMSSMAVKNLILLCTEIKSFDRDNRRLIYKRLTEYRYNICRFRYSKMSTSSANSWVYCQPNRTELITTINCTQYCY